MILSSQRQHVVIMLPDPFLLEVYCFIVIVRS